MLPKKGPNWEHKDKVSRIQVSLVLTCRCQQWDSSCAESSLALSWSLSLDYCHTTAVHVLWPCLWTFGAVRSCVPDLFNVSTVCFPFGVSFTVFFEMLVNHFSANFVLFSKIETLMLRRTHVVPCVYFLQCPLL